MLIRRTGREKNQSRKVFKFFILLRKAEGKLGLKKPWLLERLLVLKRIQALCIWTIKKNALKASQGVAMPCQLQVRIMKEELH